MLSDLRLVLRTLRLAPGYSTIALIVLTLGIGATTAIYSVVDAVALRGLPFHRFDRLMIVEETNPTGKGLGGGYVAAPNFYDWRGQQHSFEDLAAFQFNNLSVYTDGRPETLRTLMVSSSLMPMLRAQPRIGRMFASEQEVVGRHHVAVISDRLWRSRFNANEQIVGQTFTVGTPDEIAAGQRDAGVWEVVGVMPEGFEFPVGRLQPVDVWTPFIPRVDEYPRGDGSSRNYNAQVIGRLRDGVTREQAYAEMSGITAALKAQYPKWFADRWVGVTPLLESLVGKTRGWMFLLLGAVAFVLLIACVNVANLTLARATARGHEVSVRAALGASRWQLARGLMAESLVLSVVGTALGVLAAYWGVGAMRASLPPNLPRLSAIAIDTRVLSASALLAVLTGILVGLLPAWQSSTAAPAGALREASRGGGAGPRRQRARSMLLVAEVAIAIVLLVGAGLFVTSFLKLTRIDVGVDTARVVTIGVYPRVDFTKQQIDADMARAGVQTMQVLERARAMPGADVVAIASGTSPLQTGWSRSNLQVPGRPKSTDPDDSPDQHSIMGDYFKAVGIPLLRGREFTATDSAPGAEPVIIINDVAAKRFFDGQDPLGVTVESNGKRRIVGVVRAVRLAGPEAQLRPEVYLPFNPQRAFGGTLYVRTAKDPQALAGDLRALVSSVLTTVVVPEARTFTQMYDALIVQRKFNMIVLALFGLLAIVIAAAGIFGVMTYIVEQRTREIGVRMALGAQRGQVVVMVLSRATAFLLIGVALGLAGGWGLAKFVESFLFQVDARDLSVYAVAAVVLMFTGLAAAFVPARRASRVNPVTVLK